jgi:hypothetical protein
VVRNAGDFVFLRGDHALNSAHQQQDQQNDDNEAQAAAAVVSGPIERTAADPRETAEQGDDQNDEDDRPDTHGLASRRAADFS